MANAAGSIMVKFVVQLQCSMSTIRCLKNIFKTRLNDFVCKPHVRSQRRFLPRLPFEAVSVAFRPISFLHNATYRCLLCRFASKESLAARGACTVDPSPAPHRAQSARIASKMGSVRTSAPARNGLLARFVALVFFSQVSPAANLRAEVTEIVCGSI